MRYEGLTERFGDIVLVCSGAAPGTMLTGNVTLYFPVAITNRIDANSQTRDAVLSVDTGSGFAPSSIAGLVAQNSISFNGLSFAAPTGSINLKVSGVRGAVSNLGKIPQTQVVASISSPLLVNQASVIVGYTAGGLTATLYSTGIT
ncbi:MAG TPA: hypothetical protein VMS37_32420, partial [Verrucomicrobiae bacterium]|nr:hypothetical protein [Verrucomicrobiae bacterium]